MQVQIHGPVCLSENVDCIVANSRHRTDKKVVKMLEKFIERNHCNLIWMDPPTASSADIYENESDSDDEYDYSEATVAYPGYTIPPYHHYHKRGDYHKRGGYHYSHFPMHGGYSHPYFWQSSISLHNTLIVICSYLVTSSFSSEYMTCVNIV